MKKYKLTNESKEVLGIKVFRVVALKDFGNVKKGDKVLFGRYAGTEIKIEGTDFLMMREEDILGVFN